MLLSTIVKRFGNVRVLCMGDVMLDHFLYGKVERISPEAPVPVFQRGSEKTMLGGAGNVVSNLHALGCMTEAVCLVGNDAAGREIRCLLDACCENSLPIDVPGFPTVEKTRIIAGNNHLLRIDSECRFEWGHEAERMLNKDLEGRVSRADVVLLSDYDKGFFSPERCQRIIALCRKLGKAVIVDPKGSDYSRYAGATVVKPNLKEFNLATGIHCSTQAFDFQESLKKGAWKLFQCFQIENVLVTLSEYGMAFISARHPEQVFQIPTEAREVFDVSGAGDTSLAVLGAALAAGADIRSAMKLANIASGIAVGKLGTSSVTAEEILDELSRRRAAPDGWKQKSKIVSLREAVEVTRRCREEHRTVGFTNGCFDLLHQGHLSSLMQAHRQCDVLMVGLNTDDSVRRLKGEARPIQSEKTRALLLASLEFVDFVILFDEDTALSVVEAIRPDYIFKEGYALSEWPEASFVESYGGKAVPLQRLEGFSTTSLIRSIKDKLRYDNSTGFAENEATSLSLGKRRSSC